jgi:hypothetical protein
MEYNKLIKEYLDVENEDIVAFLFEKKEPTKLDDELFKDGFHIMYPEIACSYKLQHIMRHKVVNYFENNKKNKLFPNVKCENRLDDIIDKAVIKNSGLMMFGGRKSPKHYTYKVTGAYDYESKKLDINKKLKKIKNYAEYFSLHRFRNNEEYIAELNEDYPEEYIDEEYGKLNIEPKNKNKVRKLYNW